MAARSDETNTTNTGRWYFSETEMSRVSTNRQCDVCKLGISKMAWLTCKRCYNFDLCDDCVKIHGTAKYTDSSKPLCKPPSQDDTFGQATTREWVPTGQHDVQHSLGTTHFVFNVKNDPTKPARDHRVNALANTDEIIRGKRDLYVILERLTKAKVDKSQALSDTERENLAIKVLNFMEQVKQVNILSLDGGGVRGYMPVKLLQRISTDYYHSVDPSSTLPVNASSSSTSNPERTQQHIKFAREHQTNFIDQFDYIAGTSTGGLIAFALFLEIDLPEVESIYKDFDTYFTLSPVASWAKMFGISLPVFAAKYSPKAIHARLAQLLADKNKTRPADRQIETLGDCHQYALEKAAAAGHPDRVQHLIISTFNMTKSQAYIFNSSFPRHSNYKILDLLKSTMAAPTYFPPHLMVPLAPDNDLNNYVDGGIFANDPEMAALWAAYMDNNTGNAIYRIFALGTGMYPYTVPARMPDELLEVDSSLWGWISFKSWLHWAMNLRTKWHEAFQGGYLSWFANGGQLINVILEANRSFTETFTTELARFSHLERFRFNLETASEAALDDPNFVAAFDKELERICQRPDYDALLVFLNKYVRFYKREY